MQTYVEHGLLAADVVESAANHAEASILPVTTEDERGLSEHLVTSAKQTTQATVAAVHNISATNPLEHPNALQATFGSFDDDDLVERAKRDAPESGTYTISRQPEWSSKHISLPTASCDNGNSYSSLIW